MGLGTSLAGPELRKHFGSVVGLEVVVERLNTQFDIAIDWVDVMAEEMGKKRGAEVADGAGEVTHVASDAGGTYKRVDKLFVLLVEIQGHVGKGAGGEDIGEEIVGVGLHLAAKIAFEGVGVGEMQQSDMLLEFVLGEPPR